MAQLQKAALIVLADKSLNLANSDPTYHEKLPEFDEVTAKLKEKEEEALARHQKEFDVKVAYYERLKDIQRYYEAQKLNVNPSFPPFFIIVLTRSLGIHG